MICFYCHKNKDVIVDEYFCSKKCCNKYVESVRGTILQNVLIQDNKRKRGRNCVTCNKITYSKGVNPRCNACQTQKMIRCRGCGIIMKQKVNAHYHNNKCRIRHINFYKKKLGFRNHKSFAVNILPLLTQRVQIDYNGNVGVYFYYDKVNL